MARISDSLISGMMRPAYSDRLADGISQGMQGVSDVYTQQRVNRAADGMLSVLSTSDPTDPDVTNSVRAIARQMNIPPSVADEMIQNKVIEKNKAEEQERVKEKHLWARAAHNYENRLRTLADQEAKLTSAVAALAPKDPDRAKQLIEAADPLQQEAMREAFKGSLQLEEEIQSYRDKIKINKGFSEEDLNNIASRGEALAAAVAGYRSTKDQAPQKAAESLIRVIAEDAKSKNYKTRETTSKPLQPREGEIEAAEKLIDESGIFSGSYFWSGDTDAVGEKYNLSVALARKKKNDPSFMITEASIRSTLAEISAPTVVQTGTDPKTGKVVNKLSDGSIVYEDGTPYEG